MDSQTLENWKPEICMLYSMKYTGFWFKHEFWLNRDFGFKHGTKGRRDIFWEK